MLTLLLGTDWVTNSNRILQMIAKDVEEKRSGRVLIVPELISHDTERRLCTAAGNTCSCFAEVLTFTRLARRVSEATGHGIPDCMDDGGRVVAMASSARQLHSMLKSYAAVETKPEFLVGLLDAVDEFKRCCISAADLRQASHRSEGVFAQKLEELSLLLETYDSLCAQGKRDPRDQMNWLLEQLEDSDFAAKHTFYIDGFPDFTRQHMAIVAHLLEASDNVIISMNCDNLDSSDPAFEKAASTAREILSSAESAGIKVRIQTIEPRDDEISMICSSLFQGKLRRLPGESKCLRIYQTNSIHSECAAAAEQILDLVEQGERFKDIGVVCTDMSAYKNVIAMVFNRFKIPYYTSGSDGVLEKSVIRTVLAALDVVCGGFQQEDVLHYLKSALSVLDVSTCDKIENYAIIWNITGKAWLKEWVNHPDGLVDTWTDADRAHLRLLNEARELALLPLAQMERSLKEASNLAQMVSALYTCLEQIHLAERLEGLADLMDAAGDNRSAQILNQLWEILISALEQLYDVLGQTSWDLDTFTRLLKLLLSQYDVGTIPTVLDSVTVGPVSAMRCQQVKHLFVLGAVEGALPGYGGISGVLTDQERTALREMGIPLTGGALDGLKTEFSEIYGVFRGAQASISVSCPSGQPSFIYRRLSGLTGSEQSLEVLVGPARIDRKEAAALLLQKEQQYQTAQSLGILSEYQALKQSVNYSFGTVQRQTVDALYGSVLQLSASQVDKFADCRLSYFLKYGLRAKERKAAQVDPAEFGTYVHAVLEKTARAVVEKGSFPLVSLEETLQIAARYSEQYLREHFAQLDSSRVSYLFQRNTVELEMVVRELWEELQNSKFQPIEFELAFGAGCEMDPIQISTDSKQAQLRGFVDRVDAWQEDGRNYYRVVDYKTGKKDFDYCDVFNGLGLQMLLYLFALSKNGQHILGMNPVPAGVQYFPARAPLVNADGVLSQQEADEARRKLWKRKGLLLNDEQVLFAMESEEIPIRLPYTRRKDGTISGDLADQDQLKKLKRYVYHRLEKMVDEIVSGNVEPNPYTRGSSHNACTFCPFAAVCHPEQLDSRRDYKAMTAQRFWEEIDKEVEKLV